MRRFGWESVLDLENAEWQLLVRQLCLCFCALKRPDLRIHTFLEIEIEKLEIVECEMHARSHGRRRGVPYYCGI